MAGEQARRAQRETQRDGDFSDAEGGGRSGGAAEGNSAAGGEVVSEPMLRHRRYFPPQARPPRFLGERPLLHPLPLRHVIAPLFFLSLFPANLTLISYFFRVSVYRSPRFRNGCLPYRPHCLIIYEAKLLF